MAISVELRKKFSEIITEAGRHAVSVYRTGELNIEFKGTRDLVTRADKEVEAYLTERLGALLPGSRFFAEETASGTTDFSGDVWVIDPIDGTTNFSHGNPHCAVSVALVRNGVAEMGGVFAPFWNELFFGLRGEGAFCNGVRLYCQSKKTLETSLLALGFLNSTGERFAGTLKLLERLHHRVREFRRLGAASLELCWIASGRLDGYFEPLHPWDMAAGGLIAREAGFRVGSYIHAAKNEALPVDLQSFALICAHPDIYDELVSIITSA